MKAETRPVKKRASSHLSMLASMTTPSKRQRRQQPSLRDDDFDSVQQERETSRSARVSQEPEATYETIDLDDVCPICHLLYYRPVRTTCNHVLCEACMAHWADVSISTQMTRIGLDEAEPIVLPPNEIETKCPMCRTLTVARPDGSLETDLRAKYPQSYAARDAESDCDDDNDDNGNFVESLTLLIGNEHQLVTESDLASSRDDRNRHEWKFFIRPSSSDLIEEVHIFLHPTFRSPRVIVQYPPYEIRRLGWGTFTIEFNVILKAGYSWVSTQAEDTVDGGRKGKLPLEWTLDFAGPGSQARMRLKVKKEKDGMEEAEQRVREQSRRMWMAQRQRDPDYIPPPDLFEAPG